MRTMPVTIILFTLLVGGVALQIFLSKRQNKWLGLILPFTTFAYSLLMVFSVAVYAGMTAREVAALIASTFFIANIPTLILVGIYVACREKLKRAKEIEKMNIQDLD